MGGCGSKQKGDIQQKSPNAEPISPAKEEGIITRKMTDFKVELTKAFAGEQVGVTIVKPGNGKKALYVKAIKESGLIVKYNSAHAPEKQVSAGDYIIEINGKSGDYDQMMQELSTATKLLFTVLRDTSRAGVLATTGNPEPEPEQKSPNTEPMVPCNEDQDIARKTVEFRIELAKASAEEKLGMTVDEPESGKKALYVKALKEEGAIVNYNVLHAPFGVLAGDYIMEVNGISGDLAKMKQELRAVTSLIMTVSRECSDSANPKALVDPNEPKSNAPEIARELHPETEPAAVKGEESNKFDREKIPEDEVLAKENDAGEVLGFDADGQPDEKGALETPNRASEVNSAKTFEAGEASISVEPDMSETGPSAEATKLVCCGAL